MTTTPPRADLPWSHRQRPGVRIVITALAAMASAIIGTLAHRMGAAQNIPYGLGVALLIVVLSTWCARSRSGALGFAIHLIISSTVAWVMAVYGPGGDALIPVGFSNSTPLFSQHAGYIWLYGIILVQVPMMMLPGSWFVIHPPRSNARDAEPREERAS